MSDLCRVCGGMRQEKKCPFCFIEDLPEWRRKKIENAARRGQERRNFWVETFGKMDPLDVMKFLAFIDQTKDHYKNRCKAGWVNDVEVGILLFLDWQRTVIVQYGLNNQFPLLFGSDQGEKEDGEEKQRSG